jgi:hypothetical protein
MLFSFYPTLTRNYFVLCFIVCLGTLQWIAARNGKLTLSLLGWWGLGWPGTILGLLFVIGGFAWFFGFTPGLFAPGLAGGELTILFGAGGLSALLAARLAGAGWQRIAQHQKQQHEFRPPN